MEFNELIAEFATRHNVTNLTAIDNAAAALRRTPRNPLPLVGGEAPLPVRATARDVLKPLPLVAFYLDFAWLRSDRGRLRPLLYAK